jgi:hypothetical protein
VVLGAGCVEGAHLRHSASNFVGVVHKLLCFQPV